MFTFILFVILALVFGYFATQNTQLITITLANNVIPDVPLYMVIGASLLIGLAFSWLLSLIDSLFTAIDMRGKNSSLKQAQKTIQELTKEINQLEIENARLKGKGERGQDDDESL